MQERTLETTVGLFVILGIAALCLLALRVSGLDGLGQGDGFEVTAGFDNTGSLKVRAPVRIAGVRIGSVTAIEYDSNSYEAIVTMRIDRQFDTLPADSSASIMTSGLLGEQFIALEPGGSTDNLGDGSRIQLTQSALVMEQLIGQFLYGAAGADEDE